MKTDAEALGGFFYLILYKSGDTSSAGAYGENWPAPLYPLKISRKSKQPRSENRRRRDRTLSRPTQAGGHGARVSKCDAQYNPRGSARAERGPKQCGAIRS
jgi:hypothetical protein